MSTHDFLENQAVLVTGGTGSLLPLSRFDGGIGITSEWALRFRDGGRHCRRGRADYALIVGIPGRLAGWMSRHRHRLPPPGPGRVTVCPESRCRYHEVSHGVLRCLNLDEEAALPESVAKGQKPYDAFERQGAQDR